MQERYRIQDVNFSSPNELNIFNNNNKVQEEECNNNYNNNKNTLNESNQINPKTLRNNNYPLQVPPLTDIVDINNNEPLQTISTQSNIDAGKLDDYDIISADPTRAKAKGRDTLFNRY